MMFQIKSWINASVLFECEVPDYEPLKMRFAMQLAVSRHANLSRANLSRANLIGADLSRANLSDANLSRANLSRANLIRADLSGANLSGANLSRANLSRADLSGANLSDANLSRANLSRANLIGANLSRANLSRANLTPIRDDLWAVLSSAPLEVPGLRQALIEGRVDGSAYSGECVCLVGTLANVRHCSYDAIPGLAPDADRPAERFFLGIKKGDTPETSQFSKLAVEWIDSWPPLALMGVAVGTSDSDTTKGGG